ncbi:MAG: GDP-mannose 4,6-dehydratase, partial [Candidatus Andersenbacteria bacterium]|nr:GDP-mannose 4,6-dehydratase [Candidatus Andersenbacteria bacterium]
MSEVGELQPYFRGKKILITGGAGFIGSSLAQALVPLGAQVTILDAMLPLYGGNMFNLDGIEDEVEFHHGDIRDP